MLFLELYFLSEAVDETIERECTLAAAVSSFEGDGARSKLLIADDEEVGNLFKLCCADFLAKGFV